MENVTEEVLVPLPVIQFYCFVAFNQMLVPLKEKGHLANLTLCNKRCIKTALSRT